MRFHTTQWSIVRRAAGEDSSQARAAWCVLYETYWFPLFSYVRRQGAEPEDARDLTQGFLTSLLERDDLRRLDRARGRFRAFLLASLRHYLANDRARRGARKRGGGAISIDVADAERTYAAALATNETPDQLFDRQWAIALMTQVIGRLRDDAASRGNARAFELLQSSLADPDASRSYADIARELDMTEAAVKVAAHRLRRRYQQYIREAIAGTVDSPSDIEAELRHLIRALQR